MGRRSNVVTGVGVDGEDIKSNQVLWDDAPPWRSGSVMSYSVRISLLLIDLSEVEVDDDDDDDDGDSQR